ncbi:MAG: peptidase [Gammaproteobacteria bacterium]|jgi:putative proteasome-type protease
MTYCLAIKVESGLVFASDSRTNAGVDHFSTYSKTYAFDMPGERSFVLLSAGNLATTQAVANRIQSDLENPEAAVSLKTVRYLFDAAEYVGRLNCEAQEQHCAHPPKTHVNHEATFILGGQIGNQPHEMFLIYPEGNYIAASPAKPYLQIGEIKYGKPILDRVVRPDTTLEDAARCALVSLDSTMRSNLSVGAPFEITIYDRDSLNTGRRLSFDVDDPFFMDLQESWNEALKNSFTTLPRFNWETD